MPAQEVGADEDEARGVPMAVCGAPSWNRSADASNLPGWGMDGVALHAKDTGVPPEKWCVTKADLQQLRRDISMEVAAGRIVPTKLDPFDVLDDKLGPNVYTIVDQYIKPLTKEAGSMSYALLKHPGGIVCDLFVTHCWAEGIYEFIEKVLESWPRGKAAAWICFCANPQNLDISDLIREPRLSPFATALHVASHMLVVANTKCSIYTRVWCVYEAWLAMSGPKIILTARLSQRRTIMMSILVLSAIFAVAFLLSGSFAEHHGPIDACLVVAVLGSWFVRHRLLRFGLHVIGSFATGILFADASLPRETLVFFVLREVDSIFQTAITRERYFLQLDFAGVQHAFSSNEEDKAHILSDIGDEVDSVNESVAVLQQSGVSTAALRMSHSLGLPTYGAADVNWTITVLLLDLIISSVLPNFYACWSPGSTLVRILIITSSLGYLCSMKRYLDSEVDERSFFLSALFKGVCLVLWQEASCVMFGNSAGWFEHTAQLSIVRTFGTSLWTSILCVLCAYGRHGMLKWPWIGGPLVRLLTPGCRNCRRRFLVGLMGMILLAPVPYMATMLFLMRLLPAPPTYW